MKPALLLLLLCAPPWMPSAEDMPTLQDASRFPPSWECREQAERCTQLEQYYDWLKFYTPNKTPIEKAQAELRLAREVWERMARVRDERVMEVVRQQELILLRLMIGPYAYEKGWTPVRLPANLPSAPSPRAWSQPG